MLLFSIDFYERAAHLLYLLKGKRAALWKPKQIEKNKMEYQHKVYKSYAPRISHTANRPETIVHVSVNTCTSERRNDRALWQRKK